MPEVATPNQAEREFETGEDEFFKAHSELNALNAKRTYDEYQDIALTSARRSQEHSDELKLRSTRSFDALLELQQKVNESHFRNLDATRIELEHIRSQRQRYADMWAYEQAYDLGNPTTTGAGDALRAAAVPSNRITDTVGAVAGGTVDVAAAGVATANLGVLQQLIAQLTQATQAIAANVPVLVTAAGGASTPSQTQAKPTA